jgi:hypothetical protein
MIQERSARTRRDRWADWAVIGCLVLALLLGWAVMALAQGRRNTYANSEAGFTVRYPADWLQRDTEGSALRVVDPASGSYKTTFEIRTAMLDQTQDPASALALVLNNASLSRAQKTSAYRLFDIVEGQEIDGWPSMEATYVFVHEPSDIFVQQMPVVILGLDIAVAGPEQAYVFTLLAAQENFDQAEAMFRKFVKSAEIQ